MGLFVFDNLEFAQKENENRRSSVSIASSGIPVYVSGKFPHSVIGKGQVKSSTDRLYPGNNDMPTFMDHRSDVKMLKT